MKEAFEEPPEVLLDDVMSELDEGRQTFILNYLDSWQVFITCCDEENISRIADLEVTVERLENRE